MLIYATADELAAYMEPDTDPPTPITNGTVLVRSASALVTSAIAAAQYRTDDDGMPTDATLVQALKDATCEQAQAWSLNNIDPRLGAAGLKPIVTTKSLGGAAVSYGQSAAIQDALVALAAGDTLIPSAFDILANAGLISNRVGTVVNVGRTYALSDPLLVLGE